jgi:hypothetical protein
MAFHTALWLCLAVEGGLVLFSGVSRASPFPSGLPVRALRSIFRVRCVVGGPARVPATLCGEFRGDTYITIYTRINGQTSHSQEFIGVPEPAAIAILIVKLLVIGGLIVSRRSVSGVIRQTAIDTKRPRWQCGPERFAARKVREAGEMALASVRLCPRPSDSAAY